MANLAWTGYEDQAVKNLRAGSHEPIMIPVTILTGLTLADFTVVGRITASGKYKAYASGNTDGSEVARGILVSAITTTADTTANIYVHGEFNKAALVGIDATSIKSLQDFGIFVKEVL
jgi:hypothetical protein